MSRGLFVFDIDGTLSDSRGRNYLAREKEWSDFHKFAIHDPVHPEAIAILLALAGAGHEIVLLTGRPSENRLATISWLESAGLMGVLPLMPLIMRPEGNVNSDATLKPILLGEFLSKTGRGFSSVSAIFEDRDKVVAAWRALGIACYQVRPGGY